MPDKAFLPQTHLIRYASKHKTPDPFFSETEAFKYPLTLDIGYISS